MARPAGVSPRSIGRRAGFGRIAARRDSSPFRPRDGESGAPLVVVQVATLVAIGLGLIVVQPALSFSPAGAIGGVVSQLPTTFSAAVSIGLAAAMDLLAGAVLVRAIRWVPYASVSEAVLGGLVGAVAKNTVLLLALGSIGHFQPLAIAIVDLLLIGGALFLRPFVARAPAGPGRLRSTAWILPVVLWSIPVMVQLASPVLPFADGLPSQVAPIEHIRTYASFGSLALAPAPEYGPAGSFLGYIATVGSIASLTGLPAVLAVAAFTLPLVLLLAAASYHLALVLVGPTAAYWTLLAVPLTLPFVRLTDVSAVVLASVTAAAAISLCVPSGRLAVPAAELRGRSRGVILAAAIGATILIHPMVGALTALTVLLLTVPRTGAERRVAFASMAGALVIALPQFAAMAAVDVPAWLGVPAWPLGLAVAGGLGGPGPRRGEVSDTLQPARSLGLLTLLLLGALLIFAIGAGGAYLISLDPQLPATASTVLLPVILGFPVLLAMLAMAVLFAHELRAWMVIVAGLASGAVGLAVAAVAPGESGIGAALTVELPQVIGYWIPWMAAIGAGIGLGAVWSQDSWPSAARVAICGALVVAAAVPIRPGAASPDLREHPYAETLANGSRIAEQGYWTGYPDHRRLVDADGEALMSAIRDEQLTGRLGRTTDVLHVVSPDETLRTPLAAMTGVIETLAIAGDPDRTIPSEQSRIVLLESGDLIELLGPDYPYVVFEHAAPPRTVIEGRGYEQVALGEHWELFRLAATGD